jgi:predicted deacetylase
LDGETSAEDGDTMIAKQAQYLLRFDDLCPTMAWERFERFIPMIEEFGIRPILAVVPENCDPELEISAPDSEFWSRMRTMEAAGATIGLHGYRHLCNIRGRSLVPLHETSEFAGVPEGIQQKWIRAGMGILRGHDLNPRIWVAPRHGFDQGTLRALRSEGINAISDGFARVPFRRGGLTWIPQQLWGPVEKGRGVWTICIHSHTASEDLVEETSTFVHQHAAQFTSVDRVLDEFQPKELDMAERLYGAYSLGRMRISKLKKKLLRER